MRATAPWSPRRPGERDADGEERGGTCGVRRERVIGHVAGDVLHRAALGIGLEAPRRGAEVGRREGRSPRRLGEPLHLRGRRLVRSILGLRPSRAEIQPVGGGADADDDQPAATGPGESRPAHGRVDRFSAAGRPASARRREARAGTHGAAGVVTARPRLAVRHDDACPVRLAACEEAVARERRHGRERRRDRVDLLGRWRLRADASLERARERAPVRRREDVRERAVRESGDARGDVGHRGTQCRDDVARLIEPRRRLGARRCAHRPGDVDEEHRLRVDASRPPVDGSQDRLRCRDPCDDARSRREPRGDERGDERAGRQPDGARRVPTAVQRDRPDRQRDEPDQADREKRRIEQSDREPQHRQ